MAILDSYDAERVPHAADVIGLAIELGRVICVPDPAAARPRDVEMAPLVPPGGSVPVPMMPGISGGILAQREMAGELFIQAIVRADGAEGRLDDVIGPGWHLVTNGQPPDLDGELAAWFGSIGGRTAAIGATVEDVEGRYERVVRRARRRCRPGATGLRSLRDGSYSSGDRRAGHGAAHPARGSDNGSVTL